MTEEKKILEFIYESEEQKIGKYSDIARVGFSTFTFGFDFAQLLPPEEGDEGIVRIVTRIVMTPAHAKALLDHLAGRIELYEKEFGEIIIPKKKEKET